MMAGVTRAVDWPTPLPLVLVVTIIVSRFFIDVTFNILLRVMGRRRDVRFRVVRRVGRARYLRVVERFDDERLLPA